MHGSIGALIQPSIFFGFLFVPAGTVILAYGNREVANALYAFRFHFYTPHYNQVSRDFLPILKALILATYISSVAFFVLGCVVTIAHMDGSADEIAMHIAAALISFLYAFFICEGLLRPLKYRIEYLLDQGDKLKPSENF